MVKIVVSDEDFKRVCDVFTDKMLHDPMKDVVFKYDFLVEETANFMRANYDGVRDAISYTVSCFVDDYDKRRKDFHALSDAVGFEHDDSIGKAANWHRRDEQVKKYIFDRTYQHAVESFSEIIDADYIDFNKIDMDDVVCEEAYGEFIRNESLEYDSYYDEDE